MNEPTVEKVLASASIGQVLRVTTKLVVFEGRLQTKRKDHNGRYEATFGGDPNGISYSPGRYNFEGMPITAIENL